MANPDPSGLSREAERSREKAKEAHGCTDHRHILLHRRRTPPFLSPGNFAGEKTGVRTGGSLSSRASDDDVKERRIQL